MHKMPVAPPPLPPVRTKREAAAALGVCEATVARFIRDGRLQAVRVGQQVRILDSSLGEMLTPRPRSEGAAPAA